MTRGDVHQHSGGRKRGLGRRLRTGAMGAIAVGGAIVLGGATTLLTASAHTFSTPSTTPSTTGTADGGSWIVGTAVMKDIANLSSSVTSDRTINFFLWAPGSSNCTGTPVFTDSVPAINGPGTVTTDEAYTGAAPQAPEVVGTYQWTANIEAPNGTIEDTSTCGDEPVSLTQTEDDVDTTPSAGGHVGTAISDTATVTGGFNPTGTVIFNLYAPGDTTCAGPAVYTKTATLSGATASSGSFVTAAVGTYNWTAAYSGDTNNEADTSGCTLETVTISTAPTPTPSGNGGVQAITTTTPSTPSTGSSDSLTGITLGGFLLLGGLGAALVGSMVPRRRRNR